MGEQVKDTVFIPEKEEHEEDDPITEESLAEDGLSPEEIRMAKEQGIIGRQEDEEAGSKSKAPVEKKEKKEETKDERKDSVDVNTLDSFEKIHTLYETKPEEFRSLPAAIRALYHNSKGLYKRAKTEEQRRQDIEKQFEFGKVKESGAMSKLTKIKEALKNEKITVEDLEEILGDVKVSEVEKEAKQKEDDVKKKTEDASRFISNRAVEVEKLGMTEHEDFNDIMAKAIDYIYDVDASGKVSKDAEGNPVVKRKTYFQMLNSAMTDENMTELEIVNLIVDISKLNPKEIKKPEEKGNSKIDRIIKNAAKNPTSASIGGGARGKVKTYDELTAEDAVSMSADDWAKLPDAVRKRILKAT